MEHEQTIARPTLHCAYCGRPFVGLGRCCSGWCEAKLRGRAGYVTRSRRKAVAKVLEAAVTSGKRRKRWREIAMSAEPDPLLATLFGVDRDALPVPRHGETIS